MTTTRPFVLYLAGENLAANKLIDKMLLDVENASLADDISVNLISRTNIEEAGNKIKLKRGETKLNSAQRNARGLVTLVENFKNIENPNANSILVLYDYPTTKTEMLELMNVNAGGDFSVLDSILYFKCDADRETILAQKDDEELEQEVSPDIEADEEGLDDGEEGGIEDEDDNGEEGNIEGEEGESGDEADEGGGEEDNGEGESPEGKDDNEDPDPESEAMNPAEQDIEANGVVGENSQVSSSSKKSKSVIAEVIRTQPSTGLARDHLDRVKDLSAWIKDNKESIKGLWQDLTFDELKCSLLRQQVAARVLIPGKVVEASIVDDALTTELGNQCWNLSQRRVKEKILYRTWASNTKFVSVETDNDASNRACEACMDAAEGIYDGIWEEYEPYQKYRENMDKLSIQTHTPASVLFSMVVTLDDEATRVPLGKEQRAVVENKVLSSSGPGGFISFNTDVEKDTCDVLLRAARYPDYQSVINSAAKEGGLLTVEAGNDHILRQRDLRKELEQAYEAINIIEQTLITQQKRRSLAEAAAEQAAKEAEELEELRRSYEEARADAEARGEEVPPPPPALAAEYKDPNEEDGEYDDKENDQIEGEGSYYDNNEEGYNDQPENVAEPEEKERIPTMEEIEAEEKTVEELRKELLPSNIERLLSFFMFEKRAIAFSKIALIWGSGHTRIPLKAQLPFVERSMQDTEVMPLTSLSIADFHRYRQMQEIDNLVASKLSLPVNFSGDLKSAEGEDDSVLQRRYTRKLNGYTFFQELLAAFQKEPEFLRRYYPETDELLVALMWVPPHRRTRTSNWNPVDSMRLRATFDEYSLVLAEQKDIDDTENLVQPLSSCIDLPKEFLKRFQCDTTVITPAGRSLVLVKEIASTKDGWLTVHDGDYMFGMRPFVRLPGDEVYTPITSGGVESSPSIASLDRASLDQPSDADEGEEGAMTTDDAPEEETPPAEDDADAADIEDPDGLTGEGEEGEGDDAASGDGEIEPEPQGEIKSSSITSSSTIAVKLIPEKKREKRSTGYGLQIKGAKENMSFVCEGGDGVRYTVTSYPVPEDEEPIKPDGLGIVCLSSTMPSGLTTTIASNGAIRVHSVVENILGGNYSLLGNEHMRLYVAKGCLVRRLIGGMYEQDIINPDGSRTLVRRYWRDQVKAKEETERLQKQLIAQDKAKDEAEIEGLNNGTIDAKLPKDPVPEWGESFHRATLQYAPENWTFVVLSPTGQVTFYASMLGDLSVPLSEDTYQLPPDSKAASGNIGSDHGNESPEEHVPPEVSNSTNPNPNPFNVSNTVDECIDAETDTHVIAFTDGRVIIRHVDGLKEMFLGDGTKIVSHPSGKSVLTTRPGMPTVELDIEIDDLSREASSGGQIPLNKGGNKVRSRICLMDGSAVVIKYDNRLTSDVCGSIHMLRRDKTVVRAYDGGVVDFAPCTSWTEETKAEFDADFKDQFEDIEELKFGRMSSPEDPRSMPLTGTGMVGNNTKSNTTMGTATATSFSDDTMGLDDDAKAALAALTSNAPQLSPRSEKRNTMAVVPGDVTAGLSVDSAGAGQDKLIQTKPKMTKFSFDIESLTVNIQDFEHNSYEVDFCQRPLAPTLSLAGEVDGLAPSAVSEGPIEPRLFVISRHGQAKELVCPEEVRRMERLAVMSEDSTKVSSEIVSPPADLGGGLAHSYFTRIRSTDSVNCSTSLKFSEVFPQRKWHNRERVSAAALRVSRCIPSCNLPFGYGRPDLNPRDMQPSLYVVKLYEEMMPLSQQGFHKLTKTMQELEDFRRNRDLSIHQFAVNDDREEEELEQERQIRAKLKAMYKKIARDKKKKRKKMLNSTNSVGSLGSPGGIGHDHSQSELSQDADEDEELATLYSGDPFVAEVKAAFDSFAVAKGNHKLVLYNDLQPALIQILNVVVQVTLINDVKQELLDNGTIEAYAESDGSLAQEEFTQVAKYINLKLNPNVSQHENPETDIRLYSGGVMMLAGDLEYGDGPSISINNDIDMDQLELERSQLPSGPGGYWRSEDGLSTSKSGLLPSPERPASQQDLDWSLERSIIEERAATAEKKKAQASGSGLSAARASRR